MKTTFTAGLAALFLAATTGAVELHAATIFHVATTGDDANPGTKTKPFATFEQARDAVRQSKIQNPKTKIEVLVRAGTYELTKTFKLAAEDSGSEKAPVVYRAYPKEKVLLIGGRRISGFAPHKGAILKAEGVREHPQPVEMGPLWPDQAPVGDGTSEAVNANITVHLPAPAKANGAAVVICPGGGYQRHMVQPEGHEIARWLNEHGIAGIVLEYRMPQGRPFVPLLDAQRAIRYVRTRAADWRIAPDRIGIMGFSAGGHLASTAGTHFDNGDPKSTDAVARVSCRPGFMILVYPVVTMSDKTHSGSKKNLLGPDPKPELVELFSNEKQITDKTPPAFLAHAKDDVAVPPDNSRQFAEALKSHNVPVNYLELPSGGHGLNHYQGPMWDAWQKQSIEWLAAQGFTSRGKTQTNARTTRKAP